MGAGGLGLRAGAKLRNVVLVLARGGVAIGILGAPRSAVGVFFFAPPEEFPLVSTAAALPASCVTEAAAGLDAGVCSGAAVFAYAQRGRLALPSVTVA